MKKTRYKLGLCIFVILLLVGIVYADVVLKKGDAPSAPQLTLGEKPAEVPEVEEKKLFNPSTIYYIDENGDINSAENAEVKDLLVPSQVGAPGVMKDVIFVGEEVVKGIPLKPNVKSWIDSQKSEGKDVVWDGEKFYVTTSEQSSPYASSWKVKYPDRVRIARLETNVDLEGKTVLQKKTIQEHELNKDGDPTGKVFTTEKEDERTFDNRPVQTNEVVSEGNTVVYAKQTFYTPRKNFWGEGVVTSRAVLTFGDSKFTVDSKHSDLTYNGPTRSVKISDKETVVVTNGQLVDMSTARKILENNDEARDALGDLYVETAKGSSWWPKSFTALDWGRLIGVTLRVKDQFKGLRAINSLIKDDDYQDFVENWRDNVRRYYPVNGIGKFLESKVCESSVRKMKKQTVVGEFAGKPKGLVRVSAEQVGPLDTPVGKNFMYVITYHLENPLDEEMKYNIWLKNEKSNLPLFVDSNGNPLDEKLEIGKSAGRTKSDPVITSPGVLFDSYNEICINFHPRIQKFGQSSKTGELCDEITGFQGESSAVEEAKKDQTTQQSTGSPSQKAQLNKGFK